MQVTWDKPLYPPPPQFCLLLLTDYSQYFNAADVFVCECVRVRACVCAWWRGGGGGCGCMLDHTTLHSLLSWILSLCAHSHMHAHTHIRTHPHTSKRNTQFSRPLFISSLHVHFHQDQANILAKRTMPTSITELIRPCNFDSWKARGAESPWYLCLISKHRPQGPNTSKRSSRVASDNVDYQFTGGQRRGGVGVGGGGREKGRGTW